MFRLAHAATRAMASPLELPPLPGRPRTTPESVPIWPLPVSSPCQRSCQKRELAWQFFHSRAYSITHHKERESMTSAKPDRLTASPVPQPYVSSNPAHTFRFAKTSATCSCGWKLWRVRRELAERSHMKHLTRIEQEADSEAKSFSEMPVL